MGIPRHEIFPQSRKAAPTLLLTGGWEDIQKENLYDGCPSRRIKITLTNSIKILNL
ncbi:hypothetical protein AGR5A_Lc110059 [Agrobacterium genomosp. 5 str. CFBP 6626]|nr:hypothetical protein AGR5A_Lc110059 [Agrobacterium genomosp. 5 str. CFBP 6626]